GPNMAYLAALRRAEGRRVGFSAVAGVALGLALVGALAALGLAAAIAAEPLAYGVLRYAGAAFLLYLAWEGWRGADGEAASAGRRAAFGRALMTNLLNPKAAVFYVTVLPLFLGPPGPDLVMRNLVLVAGYVAVASAVHAAIVLFAAALRPYLVEGPREMLVRRMLALGLVFVALWFFMETRQ
ncbi:MAG: LysE family transporter, partial [Hyphomicrobiales bacterium]|nr:LysE family transporter [Hyphomicrobiales bacterium]